MSHSHSCKAELTHTLQVRAGSQGTKMQHQRPRPSPQQRQQTLRQQHAQPSWATQRPQTRQMTRKEAPRSRCPLACPATCCLGTLAAPLAPASRASRCARLLTMRSRKCTNLQRLLPVRAQRPVRRPWQHHRLTGNHTLAMVNHLKGSRAAREPNRLQTCSAPK